MGRKPDIGHGMPAAADWRTQEEIPGVNRNDYPSGKVSEARKDQPAGSRPFPADQESAEGFSPLLSGRGKAMHFHTTSFNAGSPNYSQATTPAPRPVRHPAASASGRLVRHDEENKTDE